MKVSSFACFASLALSTSLYSGSLLDKNPQKELILHTFQKLVDRDGPVEDNHFFYVRLSDKNGVIYWREGRRLWGINLDPYYEKSGPTEMSAKTVWEMRILIPFKPTYLDTGVVPDGTDTGSSTFLIHKSEVAEEVYDCVLDGELIEIHKGPSLIKGVQWCSVQEPGPKMVE